MDPNTNPPHEPSQFSPNPPPSAAALGGAEECSQIQPEQRLSDQPQQDLRQDARSTARNLSHDASERASQLKDDAKTALSDAAEQTKRKARQYTETAKVRGQELLDQQKHRAVEQLHTVGAAVHRAAEKFREDHDDNIAGYVDAMADEVDHFADYLDQHDVNSLVRDTQSFARREPEWFLGGMFLAGLALTRFLKSSGRGNGNGGADRDYEAQLSDRAQMHPHQYPQASAAAEPWAPERSISPTPTTPGQSTGSSSAEVKSHGQL